MSRTYTRTVIVVAAVMICIGFAILIRTITVGGGVVGYVVGALFIALGAGRIHLQLKLK